MKKQMCKRVAAFSLAAAMVLTMTGCGGKGEDGKKGDKQENTKDMVFAGEAMDVEGIEGDPSSNITVKGDKLYFTTYEWIEGETGADSEEADTEEETETDSEEADTEEETETDSEEADAEEETETDSEEADMEEETETDSEEADAEEETETDSEEADTEEEIVAGTSITRLYSMKLDGSEVTEIPLPKLEDNHYIQSQSVMDNGEIVLLVCAWDEKTEKQSYFFVRIDEKGEELAREDITQKLGLGTEDYLNKVLFDQDGHSIFILDQRVKVFDENLKELCELKSDNWLAGATITKDGKVICASDGGEDGPCVMEIDIAAKKWGDSQKLDISYFQSSESLLSGAGDYDFFYSDDKGIYGYKLADKKGTKLLDYVASNMNSNESYGIVPISNDEMIGTTWNNNGETSFVKYKKVDPSTITDKEVITLGAMYVDDTIKTEVINFNKKSDKYQIQIQDYSNEEDPQTKMNADIVAGNIPDIICMSGLSISQYAAKGILEDLTPYFEKDEELNTSDMIPSFYEASQIDGKLYFVTPTLNVYSLVANAKDVGDEIGWTFEDMKKLLEEKGDGVRPFYSTNKSDMFYSFLNGGLSSFIDWETGECRFDSEDFKSILEICNTYGENEEMEYDEDAPSQPSLIKEGKVLFNEGWISMDEIQLYEKMYDSDITFIGYPNEEKNGNYFQVDSPIAIYSKSEYKDAAWEFVRTFMTKEYQGHDGQIWGIPSRQDCMEMYIKERSTTEEYTDEFGETITPYESSWGWDDLEVEIGPASENEVKMFTTLIESTNRLYGGDWELIEMIQEDAKTYFEGEKSLDEVAEIIQNRMKTYVNENR